MRWLMFFVLPQLLSVSARASPSSRRHDDGAALLRFTDRELPSATRSSTTVLPAGIKITEDLARAMPSAATSTEAPTKGPPRLQRASGHGSFAAMRWLMFFVLPQLLSVSARASPSSRRHDDGAALLRFTDRELPSATRSSTTVLPAGIKITEDLARAMPSAATSTEAPTKGPPRLQRASGHGSFAAMRWLMFFVLPQLLSVSARASPSSRRHDDGAALLRFTDRELPSATRSSTTVLPAGIKITEDLARAMPSAATSTEAPTKGPPGYSAPVGMEALQR
ncbi:uncharacterized protein ISCGN_032106 [Ixodes scapularis]